VQFYYGAHAEDGSKRTMLTIDEIRAVPLFSTLAATDLERLAQTSADVHLGAGEFAVHEGGECALFAVLAGKIEVVKLIDGIERTLGWRVPGTIFGEVPIALGTPFPGGGGGAAGRSGAAGRRADGTDK
jgi:thioredoxin reductase (NADPH)